MLYLPLTEVTLDNKKFEKANFLSYYTFHCYQYKKRMNKQKKGRNKEREKTRKHSTWTHRIPTISSELWSHLKLKWVIEAPVTQNVWWKCLIESIDFLNKCTLMLHGNWSKLGTCLERFQRSNLRIRNGGGCKHRTSSFLSSKILWFFFFSLIL